MTTVTRINPMARTFRSYMDEFVNKTLFDGLQNLCRERPDNPIEFLAYYLIENNSKLEQKEKIPDVQENKKDENNAQV